MYTLAFSGTCRRKYWLSTLILIVTCAVSTSFAQDTTAGNSKVFVEGDTLYVETMILTHQVINRQPTDTVHTFQVSDDKAWCYARVYNSGAQRQLHFVWYLENKAYFTFPTTIGTSPGWRTYSNVTLQPGRWHVKLQTEKGQVLTEKTFEVTDQP